MAAPYCRALTAPSVSPPRPRAAGSGHAPAFGKGARFCSLGPDWEDGDTVEVMMPMR